MKQDLSQPETVAHFLRLSTVMLTSVLTQTSEHLGSYRLQLTAEAMGDYLLDPQSQYRNQCSHILEVQGYAHKNDWSERALFLIKDSKFVVDSPRALQLILQGISEQPKDTNLEEIAKLLRQTLASMVNLRSIENLRLIQEHFDYLCYLTEIKTPLFPTHEPGTDGETIIQPELSTWLTMASVGGEVISARGLLRCTAPNCEHEFTIDEAGIHTIDDPHAIDKAENLIDAIGIMLTAISKAQEKSQERLSHERSDEEEDE